MMGGEEDIRPGLEIVDSTRYRFNRLIGKGGMGSVYEAVCFGVQGFEKLMALKVILPKFSQDKHFAARFVREAKLVADLVHVHIVQIYHFGEIDEGAMAGRLYIAMEYVHGPTLLDLMEEHLKAGHPFPPSLAVYICSRVARALEYAHHKRDRYGRLLGIVHRDISPGNVLISSEGEVKLLDFGVAKVEQWEEEDEEMLLGKARYMAPEYIRGQKPDPRVDLYALGIVLWEVLAGRPCFEGEKFSEIIDRVTKEPPPPIRTIRPDISEEIEEIILKATRPDPADRYEHAGLMANALEEAIYRGGLGPTFVTLAHHLSEFFPGLVVDPWLLEKDGTTVAGPELSTIVATRHRGVV